MSKWQTKAPESKTTGDKKEYAYWKSALWVIGGFILGFMLGGPLGAMVLGFSSYFLPLRYFTRKWDRSGHIGIYVLAISVLMLLWEMKNNSRLA